MSLQFVPTAGTQRGAWVVELMQQASLPSVPDLRKQALREACRAASTEEVLYDVFLDAICGSPYIDDDTKYHLADFVLTGRWNDLALALGVTHEMHPRMNITSSERLIDFKYMATRLYTKSRKIQKLPLQRKRAIGAALLSCSTYEDIMELLVKSLETSQTMSERSKLLIANDVFEGYFHRLLLTDRFDCDERPRIMFPPNEEEREDCIICFGPFPRGEVRRLQGCGHEFCPDCIQDWAGKYGNPFPCPVCRSGSTLEIACVSTLESDCVSTLEITRGGSGIESDDEVFSC